MPIKELYRYEDSTGKFTLVVQANLGREFTDEDCKIVHRNCDTMIKEFRVESAKIDLANSDSEVSKAKKEWLAEAENVFNQAGLAPIYIKEIPNEYCSQPCCLHRPWLNVTCCIGCVKIGWRKRVINIDWTDTVVNKLGKDLFPAEHAARYPTVGEKYIHAYSYVEAITYLKVLNYSRYTHLSCTAN